jgi:hypothetical protein
LDGGDRIGEDVDGPEQSRAEWEVGRTGANRSRELRTRKVLGWELARRGPGETGGSGAWLVDRPRGAGGDPIGRQVVASRAAEVSSWKIFHQRAVTKQMAAGAERQEWAIHIKTKLPKKYLSKKKTMHLLLMKEEEHPQFCGDTWIAALNYFYHVN